MSAFYKFLFPMKPDGTAISLLLLALRLLFEVYCFRMGYRSGRILRACPPHFRTHWELDIRFL